MSQEDFIWAGWIAVGMCAALICYGMEIAYEIWRGPSV